LFRLYVVVRSNYILIVSDKRLMSKRVSFKIKKLAITGSNSKGLTVPAQYIKDGYVDPEKPAIITIYQGSEL